ncbi:MAG: alkylglycerol monooxygenase [Saprospiraceae bacterium]|jgi:alkylglycerol monooxygenase
MEAYATVLSYAIPGFVILIIIEYLMSLYMSQKIVTSMDTISSLSSGLTNTLKEVVGLGIVIISYGWMESHLALFKIPSTFLVFIVALVLIDFASYWSHRFNHEINLMWNRHIVHHSSEEFNLACALRQSISAVVGVYFFLYIPMAIVGIPGKVIAIIAPLHLFAQFWYHTRLINRMGFLEYILVTPSHHRVHHAINPEYIDKNYAAIFIIWDKLFGTFQEESPEIPPVYGVKKPVHTWNPILINYQHLWQLIKDAWRAEDLWDKARIWFMPTGWRPEDVKRKYPITIIEDPFSQQKYNPDIPSGLEAWSWAQLIITNLMTYHLLTHVGELTTYSIILYVLFLFISIFAYSSLMDNDFVSLIAEFVKFGLGTYIIVSYGDWFGLSSTSHLVTPFIGLYLCASLMLNMIFLWKTSQNRHRSLKRQV